MPAERSGRRSGGASAVPDCDLRAGPPPPPPPPPTPPRRPLARAAGPEHRDRRRAVTAHKKAEEALKALIQKKQELDRSLAALEYNIYQSEGNYLRHVPAGGHYIFTVDGRSGGCSREQRLFHVNDEDRLFSQSSTTYQQSVAAHERYLAQQRLQAADEPRQPVMRRLSNGSEETSSGKNTVSVAPHSRKRPKSATAIASDCDDENS